MAPLNFLRKSSEVTDDERLSLLDALRESRLFGDLSNKQIESLSPAFRIKTFSSEHITCHCPDASHDAFVLLGGVVAVTRQHHDDEHVIDLTKKGGSFNLGVLMGGEHDYAAARALERARVLAIDTRMLQELFQKDKELGYLTLRSVGRIFSAQFADQLDHLLHPGGLD